jgi:hypothetical protein
MKMFFRDLEHAIRVAVEAWRYRRHLRKGGNPDIY